MSVTDSWASAVKTLLQAARISQARLAEEAGLNRMTWNRYVRKKRDPDEDAVRSVNRAVSKLLKLPETKSYLDALAVRDGLLPRKQIGEMVLEMIGSLSGAFENGIHVAIAHALQDARIDPERIPAVLNPLFADLARLRGLRLLSMLEGRRREPFIDEVLEAFRAHRLPLDAWVRADHAKARITERFQMSIETDIAKSSDMDSRQRIALVDKIMQRFYTALAQYATAQPGPLEQSVNSLGRVKKL